MIRWTIRQLGEATKAVAFVATLCAAPWSLAEQPQAGGTLTYLQQNEARSIAGGMGGPTSQIEIAVQIQDTLLYADRGKYAPRMATSWEVSEDGLRYSFKLRDDVKWHDGKPFTSADVAYSMLEVWKKAAGNAAYDRVQSVDTPGPYAVVFRLSEPVSPDLMLAMLGSHYGLVLPKHLYEGTNYRTNPVNRAMIGTGPFRFKEWKPGQYILLEKNPDYYRKPLPYLDRIVFRIERNEANRVALMESGEADVAPRNSVALRDLDRLKNRKDLVVSSKGSDGAVWYTMLEFNLRRPTMANQKVRWAIHHAIDTARIVKTAYLGYARGADGPVPQNSPYFASDLPRYAYDPKLAEKLLDEAGFPRKADGTRLTLEFVVAQWATTTKQTGEMVKQMLGDVGIRCEIVALDFAGTIRRIYREYGFDLTASNWVASYDPGMSTFGYYWSKAILPGVPFRNAAGYRSPEADKLIEQAIAEVDGAKRLGVLRAFQRVVQHDLPILQLVETDMVNVYNARVQNMLDNDRWYYSNWATLWIKR